MKPFTLKKKSHILVFMGLFLANMVVASAWGETYVFSAPNQSWQNMDTSISGQTPCHDKAHTHKDPHCEGGCLCLHHAAPQIPLIDPGESLYRPLMSLDRLLTDAPEMVSHNPSPPHPPPKFIA